MPKDRKNDPILTLKNGAKVNARHALAMRDLLEALLHYHPDEFAALLNLCQLSPGSTASPLSQRAVQCLKDHGSLDANGALRPIIRDVVLSSYSITPDGPVLTQPFALATPEEKCLADGLEQDADRRAQKFIENARKGRGDHGPKGL